MANLEFYEAVLREELPISKEYGDKGWPALLYPFFLACMQRPGTDMAARKAFTLHIGDALKDGSLPSTTQRIPWFIEAEIVEPHIAPKDYAAWLEREGIEPSELTQEWLTEYGESAESQASGTRAPTDPAKAKTTSSVPNQSRRGHLDHVIEAAQRGLVDPYDAPAVWAALVSLAKEKNTPLLGVSEEGIKWEDAKDGTQFLNMRNLRERLRRQRKKSQ